MQNPLLSIAAILVLVGPLTATVSAAEWGSLKGRFLVDGEAPKPAILNVAGDQFCIGHKPVDKSLIVAEGDGGLANVVIFLRLARSESVEIHPDYAARLADPVHLDNKNCEFQPHVALVRTGQSLTIKNSDPVGHNTKLGDLFNEIIPAGESRPKPISTAAVTPLQVSCSIHPFMRAYVLVQEHPYMAVSASDGRFEIKNIPAGKRSFTLWHEGPSFLRDVKTASGVTNTRGTVELTIPAGGTVDLGDIKLRLSSLKAAR